MKRILILATLVAFPVLAQQAPSELDTRINALVAEKDAHITLLSGRAATLASELAAVQAKLKAAEEKACKPQSDKKE